MKLLETTGFVSIVGAGPGDPDLLTLKAFKRIQKAECIAYDRLVADEILNYAPDTCERIYVGKHSQDCRTTWQQEDINTLLIDKANEGKRVIRLKGGDPFIFGRGSEEAIALKEEGINYEIVPGISSAIAAPAYAGIPVTHRLVSHGFTVITGHRASDCTDDGRDWQALAQSSETLVLLMAVKQCEFIVGELLRFGKDANTPAAIIANGTTLEQRVAITNLRELPKVIERDGFEAPATIVIGDVVSFGGLL